MLYQKALKNPSAVKDLQLPYRYIIPFINSFRTKNRLKGFDNRRLPFIDTKRQGLNNKIVIKLIMISWGISSASPKISLQFSVYPSAVDIAMLY
jgi:hypothetical protein